MMKDKRKALRRQMRYTAWLALDSDALIGCALSDISETGARIDVADSETIPERFTLLLSGNGSARRKCRVVWRNSRQIGVNFELRLAAVDRAGLVPHFDAAEQAEADQAETA